MLLSLLLAWVARARHPARTRSMLVMMTVAIAMTMCHDDEGADRMVRMVQMTI